jgi:hypothetical protein
MLYATALITMDTRREEEFRTVELFYIALAKDILLGIFCAQVHRKPSDEVHIISIL